VSASASGRSGTLAESSSESAKAAGLRWVDDSTPGIRREPWGTRFRYIDPGGKVIKDSDALRRMASLVIPPAWTDVWISALPNSHLQATGRDARGRKQYRYHPRWREVRDETKYHGMLAFGEALPAIREQVDRDLSKPGLPRERVLAAVVRLLDVTLIRVGNEEYTRENGSFGLVTLQARHVEIEGAKISFRFKGKSGVRHSVDLEDRRVARVLDRCMDLPGEELFEWAAEDGEVRQITADDVNGYLRDITGQDFSSKDFRTWAATVLAACALHELGPFETKHEAKRHTVEAIQRVSRRLGNTPAVCRRCYVHPDVLDAHADGSLWKVRMRTDSAVKSRNGLREEERAVLRLLRKRLKQAA
jgi:DNA topoisomerase-1